MLRSLSCLLVLSVTPIVAFAGDSKLEANNDSDALDHPIALEVFPGVIELDGPRAWQQLLVTGRYADGSLSDLTADCRWLPAKPDILTIDDSGLARGVANGRTQLAVEVAGLSATIPVQVTRRNQNQPVSFRRELLPVLSTAGCSDIRCHGAPSGKDGFRLSLWGSDPGFDYQQLTHAELGRRTNALQPHSSLILNKALSRVPHVGGRRFAPRSDLAAIMHDWQAEGLRDDSQPVELESLVVTPAQRVLKAPSVHQQLAVQAHFRDGRRADVTRLTAFTSSDMAIADIDRQGTVHFYRQGEVAILCRYMGRMETVRLMHIAAPAEDYVWTHPPAANHVDTHVFAKLKMLNIAPSKLCSDQQFIRRLYLDLCGILPDPDTTRKFVADTAEDKRTRLIEQLLHRPEYADYWTKKWFDVLRVSRDAINYEGAKTFHGWLHQRIATDEPFDETVRQMLTATGQSYENGPANFYCVTRTPQQISDPFYLQKDLAEATAQLFLGVRLQCARCHNHPYERWTQDDYLGLAAHFAQIKRTRLGKAGPSGRAERREIEISLDPAAAELIHESTGEKVLPDLPAGSTPVAPNEQDRRHSLAAWLTHQDNPYFAKAVVNRIWFHLHGRGIVEPVDDFRDSNPSANDPLLDALASEFVAGGFRIKPVIRSIVSSRTYQLSPATNSSNREDQKYFSHRIPRPLPAEVLLDAVCDVTDVPEQFEITQDYTIGLPPGTMKLPAGTRAVQLPVNDIMTLINTASKYVRYEPHPFLRTFGQPSRTQTCECDREQHFGRKQALELLIGRMLSDRLARTDNRLGRLLQAEVSDAEILDDFYWRALSRQPSPESRSAMLAHVAAGGDRRQAWEDVLWTLLNSQEFIYQH